MNKPVNIFFKGKKRKVYGFFFILVKKKQQKNKIGPAAGKKDIVKFSMIMRLKNGQLLESTASTSLLKTQIQAIHSKDIMNWACIKISFE